MKGPKPPGPSLADLNEGLDQVSQPWQDLSILSPDGQRSSDVLSALRVPVGGARGSPGREFFRLVGSPNDKLEIYGHLAADERSTKVGTHIKIM